MGVGDRIALHFFPGDSDNKDSACNAGDLGSQAADLHYGCGAIGLQGDYWAREKWMGLRQVKTKL